MGRCLSLTIFLVSLRLAFRSDVQITPHLKSAFSCRSSEASTNTNLIDEAVSTLGKAAFVNITCQPSLYGISAKMTLASMSLSHILYAVNLWANVWIEVVGSFWPILFLVHAGIDVSQSISSRILRLSQNIIPQFPVATCSELCKYYFAQSKSWRVCGYYESCSHWFEFVAFVYFYGTQ